MPRKPASPIFFENFVGREKFRRLPFVDMRIDFTVDEFLQRALQFKVFLGIDHSMPSDRKLDGTQRSALGFTADRQDVSQHLARIARVDDAVVEQ